MGNSSHHDCHQSGCRAQVAWSTNSCFCPDHRAGNEDPKIWDGRDNDLPTGSLEPTTPTHAPTIRYEDLDLLHEKSLRLPSTPPPDKIPDGHQLVSIDVKAGTKEALNKLGFPGESYDEIVCQLIATYAYARNFVNSIKGK